jgi:hypothetical protein
VGSAGLAVGDAVGVGVVVGVGERTSGVGVGGGGAGMGMIKKTMLRATIRLRTQKAIWRDLTRDLREPRFTAYLLVSWQPVRDPGPFLWTQLYHSSRPDAKTFEVSWHGGRCIVDGWLNAMSPMRNGPPPFFL